MEKLMKKETDLMLLSEFSEGMTGVRQAYVVKCRQGVDVYGSTFITFYFKTADDAVVVGRKFKVDVANLHVLLKQINKSIVSVDFSVQIYNGAYSLVVNSVTGIANADPTPFFYNFAKADEVFNKLNDKALSLGLDNLNPVMKHGSLFAIDYGKLGAFVELLGVVYNVLCAKQSDYQDDILTCFFSVAQPYYSYLAFAEKDGHVPRKVLIDIVSISGTDRVSTIVTDTLLCLVMNQTPEHFYSHLICNAFSLAKEQIRLERLVHSSPKDTVVVDGQQTIIYY